jgi:hypothetical protein
MCLHNYFLRISIDMELNATVLCKLHLFFNLHNFLSFQAFTVADRLIDFWDFT